MAVFPARGWSDAAGANELYEAVNAFFTRKDAIRELMRVWGP
jgi:hypothetical protein